jgi:TorA maturation chaperone TorD
MEFETPDAPLAEAGRAPLRSDIYALLAVLLVEPPSAVRLKQLSRLETAVDPPATIAWCLRRLKAAARRGDAETVAREYANLFIGLGRGEIVPYASWYLERLLLSAPLARLRDDLSALNIYRRDGVPEPEDHAGALCESMVLIIEKPSLSVRRQARFFHRHLAPWMIRFFRDLQRARSAVFYRTVGRLGEEFMRLEQDMLQSQFIEEV